MTVSYLLSRIAVMAVVTYLVRIIPMVMVKKKFSSVYIESFLYYVPYAVLAAMVIPDIFTATASIWSALIGLAVAVILSLYDKSLMTVALFSCIAVYLSEFIMSRI